MAEAAIEAGAEVILISGPTSLTPPERARLIQVTSAREMHTAAMQEAMRKGETPELVEALDKLMCGLFRFRSK